MHRFRRLMVALSGTDTDAALLRYAASVVRLGSATEVHFLHVAPNATDAVRREIEQVVRNNFTVVPDAVKLSIDVQSGPLFDRLLAYTAAKEVDLLFLGHRHSGRLAVARRMAMKAPCSIWMVPEASSPAFDRILVPVDFSEHSADTLGVATSLAALMGVSACLALHVYLNTARFTDEGYDQVLRGEEQVAFKKFVAPLDLSGIAVTPLFEEGANVAHVINRVVEHHDCNLVVMATRGRSRSAAILLGSVTEDTITETRVPLLIVKHAGSQLGLLQALVDLSFAKRSPQFD